MLEFQRNRFNLDNFEKIQKLGRNDMIQRKKDIKYEIYYKPTDFDSNEIRTPRSGLLWTPKLVEDPKVS